MTSRPTNLLRASVASGAFGALCIAVILVGVTAFKLPGVITLSDLLQIGLVVCCWAALGALAGFCYVLPLAKALDRIGLAGPFVMLLLFLAPAPVISGILPPDFAISIVGWGVFGWPCMLALAYRPRSISSAARPSDSSGAL